VGVVSWASRLPLPITSLNPRTRRRRRKKKRRRRRRRGGEEEGRREERSNSRSRSGL